MSKRYYYYYKSPKNYYAVAVGRKRGIYKSWLVAIAQVEGYSGFSMKGFETYEEALVFMKTAGIKSSSTVETEKQLNQIVTDEQFQQYQYYSVAHGRKNGIYRDVYEAIAQVRGYSGFSMRGFMTYEAALAFLKSAGLNHGRTITSLSEQTSNSSSDSKSSKDHCQIMESENAEKTGSSISNKTDLHKYEVKTPTQQSGGLVNSNGLSSVSKDESTKENLTEASSETGQLMEASSDSNKKSQADEVSSTCEPSGTPNTDVGAEKTNSRLEEESTVVIESLGQLTIENDAYSEGEKKASRTATEANEVPEKPEPINELERSTLSENCHNANPGQPSLSAQT